MADIKAHNPVSSPTEGDGVNYRGIVVFVVILAVTTIVCELIVVGMYKMLDSKSRDNAVARAPLSAPAGTLPPPPNLLLDEPTNLNTFRDKEAHELESYGWQDKNAGVVRLPIDRAKELVLERGFPVRGAVAPAPVEAAKAEIKK